MSLRSHDRGFSLIEAMVASVIMLIGLLGLAGLQVVGMRANNLGKRMSQAALLAQDLVQNMQIWDYATDSRLKAKNQVGLFTDTNNATISRTFDLKNKQTPTSNTDGAAVLFDYSDAPAEGWVNTPNALGATYEGVTSPVDTTLAAGEQTIFTRYWNVYNIDLTNSGIAQGKLVTVFVRWKEPNFGWRTVTTSFFKYDPSEFNQ